MNIDPISNIAASTQAMGELLQQMTVAQQGLDEKMLQAAAVEAEAAPAAGGIDVTA